MLDELLQGLFLFIKEFWGGIEGLLILKLLVQFDS